MKAYLPILYGSDWRPSTKGISNHLQSRWVDFVYLNVESDDTAAQEIKEQYEGKLKFPVVRIGDTWLKNPKIPQLSQVLKQYQLI